METIKSKSLRLFVFSFLRIALSLLLLFSFTDSFGKINGQTQATAANCDDYLQQYQNERGLCNSFYRTYSTATNPSLKSSALRSVRATQRVMRNIRERAAQDGCNIPVAPEESY